MYFFNPYPTFYKSSPLEVKRLMPLLKLIWNGDKLDIFYGTPYLNDNPVKIKDAKPIVAALAHLLDAPITLLENLSPSIKGASGNSFSSQTLHHTDLNKDTVIGQTFNLNRKTKSGKPPRHFGCNAKQINSAFQKFWRRCGFPEPTRWSRPSIRTLGSKFLTGHLTTYKKTGNLKYINETVESVFFTHEQILEAIPPGLKCKTGQTNLKHAVNRNSTTPSRLVPTYNTFHAHNYPFAEHIETGLEKDSSTCRDKYISHSPVGGGSTKSYIYDKEAVGSDDEIDLDDDPF
jgi:hypothetical protein